MIKLHNTADSDGMNENAFNVLKRYVSDNHRAYKQRGTLLIAETDCPFIHYFAY